MAKPNRSRYMPNVLGFAVVIDSLTTIRKSIYC